MRKWERRKSKAGFMALAALLLMLAVSMALADAYPYVGTTNDDTNMRRTPNSSQANIIARIPEGDTVTVLGASGNFYRVEYDGRTGYVFKQYVEKSSGSASGSTSMNGSTLTATGYPYDTVALDDVNLRASRSISSKRLGTIAAGDKVTVKGIKGDWAQVTYQGKSGWCMKKYISVATIVAATATPAPAPTLQPGTDASSFQVLQSGSDGDQVMALQEALTELGYFIGKADGIYGSQTAQAVMAFQRVNEYPITGVVDANLQALIYNGKPKNAEGKATAIKTLPALDGISVRLGDKGIIVRTIQSRLIALGLYKGTVTGTYDSATVKAVKAFQKQEGLKQDGVCGDTTQALLLGNLPTPTPVATPTPTPLPVLVKPKDTVREGSRGNDARLVQERLITLGYLADKADGIFGDASVTALKDFQRRNGLKQDGVAGSDTNEVLFSHLAIPAYVNITPAPTSGTATAKPTATPTFEAITRDNVVVIRLGATGEAVRRLQYRLTELGYYQSTFDGVCRTEDEAAIRAFQRMNRLDVDGVAGYDTQVALYAATAVMDGGQQMAGSVSGASTTLKKGMTGTAVKELQERLITLGYLTGKADGIFGTDTAEAVYSFQKRSGLTRDGKAGPKTLAAIYSMAAVTPSPAPTVTPNTSATIETGLTLQKGDVSSTVKAMQEKLISLGYLTGKADGNFGAQTYRAVLAFQKANALRADGIAGKNTLAALNSAGNAGGGIIPGNGSGDTNNAPTITVSPDASLGLGTTVRVSAENVIYEYWYSTVRAACRKYPYATVYDYSTGISWQVHMFSYGKHAEAEPLTANDTHKMEQAFGGNTWTPKSVWVIFADGTIRMATTHSVPHEVQHITDNDFPGHTCIHFPRTQAQVTAIGPYATKHQKEVERGWLETQAMAK